MSQRWRDRWRPVRARADWGRLHHTPVELLAFSHPDYIGVSRSTQTLLSVHASSAWVGLAEGDVSTAARIAELVAAVDACGARLVIFSGFADGYAEAIRALARALPAVRVRVLWHGSVLQNVEDCNWDPLTTVLALGREKAIDRIGFLKHGMAELLARTGVDTQWLFNFVETIPEVASASPRDGRVHLGWWSAGDAWRKNPYAMLSAAALVDKAVVSGILDARGREWCQLLGVPLEAVYGTPLEHSRLLQQLAVQHCNLYVTLSECSPLLPLESLSQGTPCLVSATSHLFEDAPVLRDTLVVERLDDPHAIAESIRAACERRDEIVSAYRAYAPAYNARARLAAKTFLEAS